MIQTIVKSFYKWLLKISARALFNKMDANKDGTIDKEEVQRFINDLLKIANGGFKKIKLNCKK